VLEVEGGQPHLARYLGAGLTPAEAPGDHQVDDQEVLVFQLEDDSLAETPQPDDAAADAGVDRRLDGADEERVGKANPRQYVPNRARLERVEVQLDVGIFRHALNPSVRLSGASINPVIRPDPAETRRVRANGLCH
jgi:hypothetical protein